MYGLGLLKAFVVVIALALFVVPWWIFATDVWTAEAKIDFDDGLVYLANLSAGVLASAFAIVLGVKGAGGGDFGTLLTWAKAPDWTKLVLTICVWLYFGVGALVLAAYIKDLRREASFAPAELQDFALVFAGYTVTYLAVLIGVTQRPRG